MDIAFKDPNIKNKNIKDPNIKDIKYLLDEANNELGETIEKFRIITNIWLKIYYEANYLVIEHENFRNVTIRKAKDLKIQIKKIKKTERNIETFRYLYKLLKKFLRKYDI